MQAKKFQKYQDYSMNRKNELNLKIRSQIMLAGNDHNLNEILQNESICKISHNVFDNKYFPNDMKYNNNLFQVNIISKLFYYNDLTLP